MQRKYVRIRELASVPGREGLLPVTPATVWRWVAKDIFPAPVRLSRGVTAWLVADIEEWQRQQRAGAVPADAGIQRAAEASVAARRAKRACGVPA